MVKKLMLPQEIETFYIIPTVRKHMAIFMKENGMKQMEIAKLLAIRDAAVSQYLNEKRGNKLKFDEEILTAIKKSVKKIKDTTSMIKEMQSILTLVRKTKALCKFHKSQENIPCDCNPEEMGCLRRS